jgi:hypothetical protein
MTSQAFPAGYFAATAKNLLLLVRFFLRYPSVLTC